MISHNYTYLKIAQFLDFTTSLFQDFIISPNHINLNLSTILISFEVFAESWANLWPKLIDFRLLGLQNFTISENHTIVSISFILVPIGEFEVSTNSWHMSEKDTFHVIAQSNINHFVNLSQFHHVSLNCNDKKVVVQWPPNKGCSPPSSGCPLQQPEKSV